MEEIPENPSTFIRRKATIRLPDYDYCQPGSYFVTICTQHCRHLFGAVNDGHMRRNDIGDMVTDIWATLPD